MYQFSSYAIPNLVSAIFCLLLGLFVFTKNRRSPVYIAFFVYTLSASVWQVGTFFAALSTQPSLAFSWCRFSYLGVIFIPITMYHFIVVFLKLEKQKKFVLLSYLVGALVFVPLNFTPYLIAGVYSYPWGYWFKAGRVHPLFLAFFSFLLLTVLYNLFASYRKEKSATERARKRFLVVAFLILYFGSVDYLADYGLTVYPFGYVPVIVYLGLVAYSIVKHRLMDIRLVVARSVAYTLLLAIIGGFFVFTVSYLQRFYSGFISQNIAFVITGLAAAFGFQPLRRFLQRATDRVFAKGRYDPEKLLAAVGDILSSKIELSELTGSVLATLTREMRLTRAAFVLTNETEVSDLHAIGYYKEIPTKDVWRRATKICREGRKSTVADELEEGSEDRESMRTLDIEVLVPLPTEDKFVGVLALGEKRSGDMYTSQDLKLLEIIAPEAAIAVQNASLFKEKEKRIQELGSLYNLALSLGSTLHLDELLEQVIDEAINVTDAETGSIMLIDEESQTLSIKVSRGIHPEIHQSTRVKIGEGIAGWVARTSQPLVLIDGQDPRFQEHLKRDEIISALTVPLRVREKVIGVLSVNRKEKKEIFSEDNLRIITSFAAQAAEAIENARLYENLEQTFLGTISALAAAVDAKDHYTYGHSEMVTDLAVATAKELILSKEEIRKIEIASKLHDIGKIGIDGAILNKPGRLTEEERKIIEEHPKIAVDILKSVEPLREVIPLILYHHERYDGSGYPVGISGQAIPLGARILAVADSFNAMVSDRPYRPALDLYSAINELHDNAGTQFDPMVVEAFIRVLEKKDRTEMLVAQAD